jgi:hypothetical protein
VDDNTKKQLLDQLNAELGVKKESKDVRFDSSTGTLYGNDFKNYANAIAKAFPDKNGGCVPINMGEFGVNSRSNSGVSDSKRAQWMDAVISAAEQYGFSWHYWAFSNSGGFEVYSGAWDSNAKTVFDKYLSKTSAVK